MMQTPIHEKFNKLNKKITTLQENAGNVGADVKDKFHEALDALVKQRDAVKQTLKKCAASGADAWDSLKSGVESAVDALEQSYIKAASYLEHKREGLYLSHIEKRLESVERQLDSLRTRINKIAEPDLKTTLVESLATAREKADTVRNILETLQATEPENWEDRKNELYAAMEDAEAAYNTTVSYLPEHQEEYQQRLESSLTDLDKKIAALQKKADKAKTENKAKINESIQRLRKQQVAVRNAYEAFQVEQAKDWQAFKAEMDTKIENLERSYTEVTSLFK